MFEKLDRLRSRVEDFSTLSLYRAKNGLLSVITG